MEWTQVVGAVAVLGVVLAVVGSALSIVLNGLLVGASALAAIGVLVLVVVAVAGVAAVGRGSSEHTANPESYW